jgi:hypothetical protein
MIDRYIDFFGDGVARISPSVGLIGRTAPRHTRGAEK